MQTGRQVVDAARRARGLGAIVVLALLLAMSITACDMARSIRYFNRNVVIVSLDVFPATIGPGDSAIVVCVATDADGDTLVYDWFTDCRLRLKGSYDFVYYFDTHSNSMVVYAGTCSTSGSSADTGWVSCDVRDRRGGGAPAGTVRIVVHH